MLKLKGLDKKNLDVSALRGEIVVVSFGATWCKPCEWELAALEDLRKEYGDRKVRFLWATVESEQQASDSRLRDYVRALKVGIPVYRDTDMQSFAQFSQRVRLPMIVFFDQEGRFVAPVHRGMNPQPEQYKRMMRARIDALLGAKAAGTGGG